MGSTRELAFESEVGGPQTQGVEGGFRSPPNFGANLGGLLEFGFWVKRLNFRIGSYLGGPAGDALTSLCI